MDLGQYDEAIKDFTKCNLLDRNDMKGHLLIGECLSLLGQHTKALNSYENALKIDPLNGKLRFHIQKYDTFRSNFGEIRKNLFGSQRL